MTSAHLSSGPCRVCRSSARELGTPRCAQFAVVPARRRNLDGLRTAPGSRPRRAPALRTRSKDLAHAVHRNARASATNTDFVLRSECKDTAFIAQNEQSEAQPNRSLLLESCDPWQSIVITAICKLIARLFDHLFFDSDHSPVAKDQTPGAVGDRAGITGAKFAVGGYVRVGKFESEPASPSG
jgi:hypothetical protein